MGKLHFELRNDLCPVACGNFLTLITGKNGWGADGVNYHYKGSRIHRIKKGTLWEAGDLLDQRGNCRWVSLSSLGGWGMIGMTLGGSS